MDLEKDFELKLKRIEFLNDFIVLYNKKRDSVNDLNVIANEVNEIKSLLESCSKLLTEFQMDNRNRYDKLIEKMHEQQLLMLEMLEMDLNENPKQNELKPNLTNDKHTSEIKCPSSVLKEINNFATPNKFGSVKSNDLPSVMSISDYTKSPFATKRLRPIQLQFSDFERTISSDEFLKVPS